MLKDIEQTELSPDKKILTDGTTLQIGYFSDSKNFNQDYDANTTYIDHDSRILKTVNNNQTTSTNTDSELFFDENSNSLIQPSISSGVKLKVESSMSYLESLDPDSIIPFTIRISDHDQGLTSPEISTYFQDRKAPIDLVLVLGIENSENKKYQNFIVDYILTKACESLDRVCIAKFGDRYDNFLANDFVKINSKSQKLLSKYIANNDWKVQENSIKKIIYFCFSHQFTQKKNSIQTHILLLTDFNNDRNSLMDITNQDYNKIMKHFIEKAIRERQTVPILNSLVLPCNNNNPNFQVKYPYWLRLVFETGGVALFPPYDFIPKNITTIVNELSKSIYGIFLYNISFFINIDDMFDLKVIKTEGGMSVRQKQLNDNQYEIQMGNLLMKRKRSCLFFLQKKNKSKFKKGFSFGFDITGELYAQYSSAFSENQDKFQTKPLRFFCKMMPPNEKKTAQKIEPNVVMSYYKASYLYCLYHQILNKGSFIVDDANQLPKLITEENQTCYYQFHKWFEKNVPDTNKKIESNPKIIEIKNKIAEFQGLADIPDELYLHFLSAFFNVNTIHG